MIEDGIKISELTQTTTINDNDLIPIVQSDETKQINKKYLTRRINNYSGAEKIVGEWIDGKPLYRKVINFGQLPNASTKQVPHGIENLGGILSIRGIAYRASGNIFFPVPYSSLTLANNIQVTADGLNINIETGVDRTDINTCYIVIEYKKSTD